MTNPYYLSFEILELLLFVLCLRHAIRAGAPTVLRLLAGVAFGLLLELLAIRQAQAYQYGQFTLMVFAVPLAIGIAWGNQLYAMRLFSDATTLPGWARPILDALLIIYIDLTVDPIAIRLGMWNWRQLGLEAEYFGVPYANSWGFFWLVVSFSGAARWLGGQAGRIGRWLAPFGAISAGLFALLFTINVVGPWLPPSVMAFAVAGLLCGALIVLVSLRPRWRAPPEPLPWIVLLSSQTYFLLVGTISGVLTPPLTLLVVVLLGLSVYAFLRMRPKRIAAGSEMPCPRAR